MIVSMYHTHVHVCMYVGFQQSLVVDYNLLAKKQPPIAVLLPDAPIEMFRIFDEVCADMGICNDVHMCVYICVDVW